VGTEWSSCLLSPFWGGFQNFWEICTPLVWRVSAIHIFWLSISPQARCRCLSLHWLVCSKVGGGIFDERWTFWSLLPSTLWRISLPLEILSQTIEYIYIYDSSNIRQCISQCRCSVKCNFNHNFKWRRHTPLKSGDHRPIFYTYTYFPAEHYNPSTYTVQVKQGILPVVSFTK
jgi:hypothetical protein